MDDLKVIYTLEFDDQAIKDIKFLKKSEKQAYAKLLILLDELMEHPTVGTGKPEMLKFGYSGFYSRRITQKHRLIYRVDKESISVLIVSAVGHYNSK